MTYLAETILAAIGAVDAGFIAIMILRSKRKITRPQHTKLLNDYRAAIAGCNKQKISDTRRKYYNSIKLNQQPAQQKKQLLITDLTVA